METTREERIEEALANISVSDWDVCTALVKAINEAMQDANVDDDIWDEVFNEVNSGCTIRVY